MEYEQLENGIKIINRSISGQDLSGYYDLLAPEVVLVCHFPFPEHVGPGMVESSETTAILRRKMKPERRKHELLVAKEQDIEAMHARYQRYLIQQREKTKRKSTSAVVEEGGAAPGGEEEANPTPGAGAENTAQPSNSATAAHTPTLPDDAVPMERRVSTAIAMRTKKQQRATKQQQQQQEQGSAPRSASVSKSVKTTPQSCGAKGVALYLQSEAESIPQYSDRVQISEGRELVSEQFCFILSWMNQEKYIGDIIVQLEPRKGILQDNEVLPPPQRPKNEMDLCNLLGRQYTDRNQRLSRLTFFWGKEDLLFCDQCYFDDGFIVTVHRRMLGVDMMLERTPATQKHLSPSQRTDRVRAEISNFYGATQSRVNATSHTWPLLDYSFFDIADAYDLPKIRPLKGKVHNARTVRPAMDPRLVQGVFLNQQNDPVKSSANTRTLIKAKNKKGDEEAYEFELGNRQRASFFEHDDGAGKTGGLDGVAAPASKYDATCVRISSCGLCEHTEKLVPILRSLVANAYMNLHSLDLSDNRIEHLPDFSQLPLQKLLLHGNRISAWDEVEQNVCPLPYLFSLTLHGNPISDNNSQYWQFALSRILRHPNRLVKLKQLDFVTLSAQDYEVAASHDMFTTGNTAVFKVATTMIRTK